jgi:IPT/TIG domain
MARGEHRNVRIILNVATVVVLIVAVVAISYIVTRKSPLPLPSAGDQTMAITADGSTAYVASGSTVDVERLNGKNTTTQSRISIPGSRITHLALAPNGSDLVVAVAKATSDDLPSGAVYVVRLNQTPQRVQRVYGGNDIQAVAVASDSSFALIADRGRYVAATSGLPTESAPGSLVRLRLAGNGATVSDRLSIGFGIGSVAIAPSGAGAFVLSDGANQRGEVMSSVHLSSSSMSVVSNVSVMGNGIALSPNGATAYVGGSVVNLLDLPPVASPAPHPPAGMTTLAGFTVQAITPDGRFVYLSGGQKTGDGGLTQVLEDTSTSPPTTTSFDLTDCSTVTADPRGGTVFCGSTLSYPVAPSILSVSSSDGGESGGYTITVHGTNLEGTTNVAFGTIDASVDSVTGSSVTVTVPQGAIGTVPILVTTAGGNNAPTPPSLFTYADLPAVTALTPTSGLIQGGTRILLSGSGFSQNDTVDFGPGNPGRVLKVSADGMYLAVAAPAGSGYVDVTVTAPGGTSLVSPTARYHFVKHDPAVKAISPGTGASGGGYGMLIGGKDMNGATSVSFGDTTVKPESVASDGEYVAVMVPPGVGTVEVIVTTPSGSSAGTSDAQFTYTGS